VSARVRDLDRLDAILVSGDRWRLGINGQSFDLADQPATRRGA
jgi:hypothetical protein